MARIELQPGLVIGVIQVERRRPRNVKERGVFDRSFRLRVKDVHRVFPFPKLVLIKLVVFFRRDVLLIPRPKRLHGIERPPLDLLFRLSTLDDLAVFVPWQLFRLKVHTDRIAHIVGILFYKPLQAVLIGKVFLRLVTIEFLGEMQSDRRPPFFLFRRLYAECAAAVRLPSHRFFLARAARHDNDFFRHHECRIEADAELADHVLIAKRRVALLRFLELFQKRPRT